MNPNLGGVISLQDVKEKGTGFRAKYMAWATVAHYFNEKCQGWTFHLRQTESGSHIWAAPDGTGYLLCFFKDPEGKEYSDFPFAVMDHRNKPMDLSQISARSVSDSARRGFCAACAFQFSLGYELWADEEISQIQKEEGEKVDVQPECQLKPPVAKKKESASKPELIDEVVGFIQTKFKTQEEQIAWVADKATQFDLSGEGSKLSQMTITQLKTCIKELKTIT